MSKTSRNIPEISNVSTNNDIMTFKISNVNVSFVNALRRIILSEVETVSFDTDDYENSENLNRNGLKLAKVIKKLERITGLLEVNLKEDSALEDFFLSSLRIWSAK